MNEATLKVQDVVSISNPYASKASYRGMTGEVEWVKGTAVSVVLDDRGVNVTFGRDELSKRPLRRPLPPTLNQIING
jgi:hypothetical protein